MPEPTADDSVTNADVQLFESGNLADATIVCGDRTWKVHKVILGSRCKWFKSAFYGNLAEAVSGKIVLEEQDPDLIDILLRFIYAKDIDLPNVKDNKDIPALCVQLFRIGDFFLLHDFMEMVTKYLEAHLQKTVTSLEFETRKYDGKNPKWLVEILDGLKEAYKDSSTKTIAETLVKFMCTHKRKIFLFKDAVSVLDEIPEMGKDLMKFHIINDVVARSRGPMRLGLVVLAAITEYPNFYQADIFEPCHLYPILGYNDHLFEAVHPETEEIIKYLDWITPLAQVVIQMTSHPDSDIVRLRLRSPPRNGQVRVLFVRFEDCEAAKQYVERYCQANPRIDQVTGDIMDLAETMRRTIRER